MIYVDDAKSPWMGKRWAHLFAIPFDNESLIKFGTKIGLNPDWFQNKSSFPHFDVTQSKRKAAIREGARKITAMEGARMVLEYLKQGRRKNESQSDRVFKA